MLDAAPAEHPTEQFGDFDRNGADQHWQSELMQAVDLLDDCVVFLALGAEYLILLVKAANRAVSGDDGHVELVDLPQFAGLGLGRTGHAGQLVVHAEEVLDGYGGYGASFVL